MQDACGSEQLGVFFLRVSQAFNLLFLNTRKRYYTCEPAHYTYGTSLVHADVSGRVEGT